MGREKEKKKCKEGEDDTRCAKVMKEREGKKQDREEQR